MKKLLTILLIVLGGVLGLKGQSTDLIISEYIDGRADQQAFELFNGTNAPINLKDYVLKQSSKGGGWGWNIDLIPPAIDVQYILQLGDFVLAPDSTYVICNSTVSTTSYPGFLGHTGLYINKSSGTPGSKIISFNGNDAIGLFKNGVLIDAVGPEILPQPAPSGFDAAGYFATYSLYAGEDHTLIRKSKVLNGNTDWASSGGTTPENSEWIVMPKNDASNLGRHKMLSIKTDILTFSLAEQTKPAIIDLDAHTVSVEVVFGTPLTALTPTITVSKFATLVQSGPQDFSAPFKYTVNGEYPGYTQEWTVTVTMGSEPNHDANILTLSILNENKPAEINTTDAKITAHMAYNANLSALTPLISISNGATIDKSGPQDFSASPVVYKVTAQDNTTFRNWELTVVNDPEPNHNAEILTFTMSELAAPVTIDAVAGTIKGMLKPRTLPTSLAPTITLSPNARISPSVAQNFTNPVVYTVTAEDGVVTKTWTVTLTVNFTSIYEMQNTTAVSGDSPIKNSFVRTKGLVTGITSNSFFLQDGNGGWKGIKVRTTIVPSVAVGDSVIVTGTVKEDANLTILTAPSLLVTKINSGNTIPTPQVVVFADFNEQYEGVLVTLENVTCTDTTGMYLYKEWKSTVGSNTIYIDDDMYFKSAVPNQIFTKITGIGTYYLGSFRLLPRNANDLATSVKNEKFEMIRIYPNPVTNNLNISNLEGMSKIMISNILGQVFQIVDGQHNDIIINTSNLKSGVYILTFIDYKGNKYSKRIVKY